MTGSELFKEIKLIVPEKYETPDLLTKGNPTINEEVLSLGVKMYQEKRSMLLNIANESLTEQLKKEHSDKLKDLLEKHSKQVSQLKSDSNELAANHKREVDELEAKKKALEMSVKHLQEESSGLIKLGVEEALSVNAEKVNEKVKYLSAQNEDLQRRLAKAEEKAAERKQDDIREKERKHKELMSTLHNQMKQEEGEHNKMTETLNQHMRDLKTAMEKSQDAGSSALRECTQRLQQLTGSSTAIGQLGEDQLESFISNKFSNCKIMRTGHQKGRADILVTIETLKLTVESKRVMKLEIKEIEKFWRDIENMSSSKEANAALFVSWKDTRLHEGSKDFACEYRNGIPVIYISHAEGNPERITFSIKVLLSLVKNGMTLREHDETIDEKSKYVLDLVRELHADYVEYEKILKKDRAIMSTLNEQLTKKEKLRDKMMKKFDTTISRYPEILSQGAAKTAGDRSRHLSEQIPDQPSQGVKRKLDSE